MLKGYEAGGADYGMGYQWIGGRLYVLCFFSEKMKCLKIVAAAAA